MSVNPLRDGRPLRVAMLARVVFPLHGYGGIERHVFHLVTHLTKLGAAVTLYVQTTADGRVATAEQFPTAGDGLLSVVQLRYDYTSPALPPNS
ncbi:MAG: hypothetical protein WCG26_13420, partial [Chloroflexales bacterium]